MAYATSGRICKIRSPMDDGLTAKELVARRLREVRKARGLTQEQVAARMTRGGEPMTEHDVGRRERAEVNVSVQELLAFAIALAVVPLELMIPAVGDPSVVRIDDYGFERHGMGAWLRTGDVFGEMLENYLQPLDKEISARARAFDMATTEEERKDALAGITTAARRREHERDEPHWSRARRRRV